MGCGMTEAAKWSACRAGAQVSPQSQASSKAGLHLPRLSTRREGIRWAREEENRPAESSVGGLGQAYVKRILTAGNQRPL